MTFFPEPNYYYLHPMKVILFLLLSIILVDQRSISQSRPKLPVDSMILYLSAFGVESDYFPAISGRINFVTGSNYFQRSFYNPAVKGSEYRLRKRSLDSLLTLFRNADLQKLKQEYRVTKTDQPTSTLIIYTYKGKFIITDYGLEGEFPLQEIYKIVYRY